MCILKRTPALDTTCVLFRLSVIKNWLRKYESVSTERSLLWQKQKSSVHHQPHRVAFVLDFIPGFTANGCSYCFMVIAEEPISRN